MKVNRSNLLAPNSRMKTHLKQIHTPIASGKCCSLNSSFKESWWKARVKAARSHHEINIVKRKGISQMRPIFWSFSSSFPGQDVFVGRINESNSSTPCFDSYCENRKRTTSWFAATLIDNCLTFTPLLAILTYGFQRWCTFDDANL